MERRYVDLNGKDGKVLESTLNASNNQQRPQRRKTHAAYYNSSDKSSTGSTTKRRSLHNKLPSFQVPDLPPPLSSVDKATAHPSLCLQRPRAQRLPSHQDRRRMPPLLSTTPFSLSRRTCLLLSIPPSSRHSCLPLRCCTERRLQLRRPWEGHRNANSAIIVAIGVRSGV